jgi:hypothetical protein
MHDPAEGLSEKQSLWPGLLLGSIAHAVFVARYPFLAHEQSWDGSVFNIQDSEGSRGTIAFGTFRDQFVAVFFLEDSNRNPLRADSHTPVDTSARLFGIPVQLKALSDLALEYVLQDIDGTSVPVITAAFWSNPDGSMITANEPWPEVFEHGAILIRKQLLPLSEGMSQWANEFELSSSEIVLVENLFERRVSSTIDAIRLNKDEVQQLREIAEDETGFQASIESLAEIGFTLP